MRFVRVWLLQQEQRQWHKWRYESVIARTVDSVAARLISVQQAGDQSKNSVERRAALSVLRVIFDENSN